MTDLEAVRRGAETPVAARRDQVEGSAADLAAAFVDDPILSWFMRADAKRDAARLRFFKVLLAEAVFPDGVIERPEAGGAAAVWVPSEKLTGQPLHRELRALPMLLNATGLGRFPRLLSLRESMDMHHPSDEPHDYLWFLGVRPDCQGAGIGSRLIKAHLQRLDADGRPAFLETATPRNVPLYQRHGFQIIDEYRPGDGGPLIWAMWRDPKGA
jgi:ribosomal protein S18 acetylase RimI-like enzyme